MKLRHIVFITVIAILLTACNFTLAADVTPPPGYASPTPMPTLGPLYPASNPDIHNGAVIYMEKCAPCHGNAGLGDGPQGKELPVTVAAIGLPATATKAKPSDWYTQVTQGNLERFMPPFSSLSDQERWNVVYYAFTLHILPEQGDLGQTLFEENCADCEKYFSDLKTMSALSEDEIVQIIKNGSGEIPAFGKDFSDDEALAVAAYLRTVIFAPPPAQPTPVPASETPLSAEAGTPSAVETPNGTEQAQTTPEADNSFLTTFGNISGTVDNQTGAALPSNLTVKLRAFEHGGDPSAGPEEVDSTEVTINADGSYQFENMEIPESRIFVAELELEGISYQTDFAIVEAGMTSLVLPPLTVYATTEDLSTLKINEAQMYFDFANTEDVQIFTVYSFTNTGNKTILVNMGADQVVPFIAFPKDAKALGYEAMQNSAAFVPTDGGFAMPPSELPYGLIAFASVPKAREVAISQSAVLDIESISLYLPQGMEAEGATLSDAGLQNMETMSFQVYSATGLKKGESIEFTVSGEPSATSETADLTQNQTLLIGIGAFGLVLIIAGGWLYIRDRKKEEDLDDEDGEFEDTESTMDAIIALDDLHREGKISDEAYQKRRAELKSALKKQK
ncbi:MAG TPA: c-type cytochrome [Anaerolineales bacterium]|nr:c-type cytochrome [Anaerolineales bacterium]HNA53635.1 c-type cytochrome [Anaerolineales bacterium]HNB86245.1 c-type cytochrome [Anaerolineales bacterium]